MDKFSVIAGDIKIQDVTMKKNKNETRAEFEYSWVISRSAAIGGADCRL